MGVRERVRGRVVVEWGCATVTPEDLGELLERERSTSDLLRVDDDGGVEAVMDLTLADRVDVDDERGLLRGGLL